MLFLGARAYYEAHVPGGNEAVTNALPAALQPFWRQIFVTGSTYDALHILTISATAAELLDIPQGELVRRNAAWLADRDLRGAYKVIFNVLRPSFVATRLPRLALRYFDFGEACAELAEEGRCSAQQRQIPKLMQTWFVAAIEGFVPSALKVAGAKTARARLMNAVSDGQRQGMDTVSLNFEFTWS